MTDYDEWLSRFTEAMQSLPDSQRKNSLLPLMSAYARPGEPTQGIQMPAERFRAAVQSARNLRQLGLLEVPTGAHVA